MKMKHCFLSVLFWLFLPFLAYAQKPVATKKNFVVKGVSFEMVKIKGGSFSMGHSPVGEHAVPVHRVTLSDYYLGETEVTQELWTAVMGSNPSHWQGEHLPVENVSWTDCCRFIEQLNRLTGMNFRMPTEAEWEFAAKGGRLSQAYVYAGSNNLEDVAWYKGNCSRTHEVASKQPNELGLFDMSGNVWECCSDYYAPYQDKKEKNPRGPASGVCHVARGGSWFYTTGLCRTTTRFFNLDGRAFSSVGLRLAL